MKSGEVRWIAPAVLLLSIGAAAQVLHAPVWLAEVLAVGWRVCCSWGSQSGGAA